MDAVAPTVAKVTVLQEQVAALTARLETAAAAPVKAKGPGRPKMSDEERAAKAAEKAAAAAEKSTKPKKEPVGEAPDLDIYKIEVPVDAALCMGRLITDPDDRWSKNVYHEKQCSKKPVEDELCAICAKRLVKYLEKPDWKSGWNGRIDEDPADDEQLTLSVHMPGTKWFADVTWSGTNKSKSASPEKSAEKAAAKAAKEAEKEAKKAEKEAAKEAKKAAKEVKPKKEAKPKTKAAVGGGAAAAESVAAVEEAPVTAGYEMCLIDGDLRVHKNGNVFELDELTQEPGDYLGRLTGTPDNYGIDADADQVMSDDE
jgi:hypothetical protein